MSDQQTEPTTEQLQAVEAQTQPEVVTEPSAEQSQPEVVTESPPAEVVQESPQPVVNDAVAAAVAVTSITPPEVVDTPAQPELTAFQKKLAEVLAKGTVEQVSLITKLNAYIEEMKPGKPMSGDQGVIFQHQLWRTIFTTVENSPADQFKNLWSIILAFFHEYADGVFHESYVYRFSESWKFSKIELDGFQRIINLLKVSANPKTRGETTKQVDLDKTLSLPFSEEGRNRLLNFYKK